MAKKRPNFQSLIDSTEKARGEALGHLTHPTPPTPSPPTEEPHESVDAVLVEKDSSGIATSIQPSTSIEEAESVELPKKEEEKREYKKSKPKAAIPEVTEVLEDGQTVVVSEETNMVLTIIQKKNRKRFSSKMELLEIVVRAGLMAKFPEAEAVYNFVKEMKK